MKRYRQYIIQHEMGHAIGIYDHAHPIHDSIEGNCHPMYQQTKGTKGLCRSNPWLYPLTKKDRGTSTISKKKTKKRNKKHLKT